MIYRKIFFLLTLWLLPMQVQAQDMASLTKYDLEQALAEALKAEGTGEHVQSTMIGYYPDVLYRHETPFHPEIVLASVDRSDGRFIADIVLKEEGTNAPLGKPFTVEGRYESWIEVPMLEHRMSSADVIRMEDITWKKLPEHRIRANTILDVDALLGLSPRRVITAQRPITRDMVRRPVAIHQNERVTVKYKKGALEITALGLAMEDGAIGERIALRNADSHKTFLGVVTDAGMVKALGGHGR